MKTVFIGMPALIAAALASGCAPTSQLQLSSGRIGCASSEIVIGDVASTRRTESWSATCRGQTFYCSGTDDFREVICRPASKAPATATAALPPAPASAPLAAAAAVAADSGTPAPAAATASSVAAVETAPAPAAAPEAGATAAASATPETPAPATEPPATQPK